MSEMSEKINSGDNEEETEIEFHYIKSNYFRVLNVTGAFGGISPQLSIHMNVFGDRPPITSMIAQTITDEKKIGDETRRTAKKGIVREVEADLVLELETAKVLVEWLNGKIATIEKIMNKEDLGEPENEYITVTICFGVC